MDQGIQSMVGWLQGRNSTENTWRGKAVHDMVVREQRDEGRIGDENTPFQFMPPRQSDDEYADERRVSMIQSPSKHETFGGHYRSKP